MQISTENRKGSEMRMKPNHQNGYSKKELIKILEKIDAEQNQTEKPNKNTEDNYSYFSSKHGETR